MNGWIGVNDAEILVNTAHVEQIERSMTGKAVLHLQSGQTRLSDEPFEVIRDRIRALNPPEIVPLDPEADGSPSMVLCGAMYGSDSSPCTRPRDHILKEGRPHRCYDPYGRGHWIDFLPKPGTGPGEWVIVDQHEALKR